MMGKQGEFYQKGEEDEEESYKQELGLKKMLYKYEHENEQLRTQIKALTERLTDILAKNDDPPPPEPTPLEPPDEYRLNLLKAEMKRLYAEIERVNAEVKGRRQQVNEFQELRCVELQNQVRAEDKQMENLRGKLEKYDKIQQMKGFALQSMDLKNSSLRIGSHSDKLRSLEDELELTRKNIRELEKYRDQHDRNQLKRHSYVVTLNTKVRKIANPTKEEVEEAKKGGGVWHLDYTEENYNKIRTELNELRKEKDRIVQSLRNENIVLKRRFAELSVQTEQLNKSIHLPAIDSSRPTPRPSLPLPQSARTPSPPKLLQVGPKEFERNNDKNYSPKKLRKVQWESSVHRTTGIEWQDAHLRSPITGLNLWFDGFLLGLQVLQRMGESVQHLHLTSKMVSPVQYRLNGSDYLQNVVLWISDNRITGIQLTSAGGRNDGFGNRGKGRKFDFGIRGPQKPVFSFGKFRIANNCSQITKLGFEVV